MKYFVFAAAVAAILTTLVPSFSGNRKVDEVSREEYVQHVEAELADWEKSTDRLRVERDARDPDQFGFQVRDKAIAEMEKDSSQIRQDLRELKASSRWTRWRSKVDRDLSEMRRAYQRGQVAE